MAVAPPTELFEEIIDFLTSTPSLEEIIAYHPSEALNARLVYLLEKNQEVRLADDEQAELDEFLRMEHFMRMLKIRARKGLAA